MTNQSSLTSRWSNSPELFATLGRIESSHCRRPRRAPIAGSQRERDPAQGVIPPWRHRLAAFPMSSLARTVCNIRRADVEEFSLRSTPEDVPVASGRLPGTALVIHGKWSVDGRPGGGLGGNLTGVECRGLAE